MHEIFGERIMLREAPAWHGLGTVFTDPMTATEAADAGGLFDYEVVKCPVKIDVPDEWSTLTTDDLDLVTTTDFMVVRSPTTDDPKIKVFGHVSDQYEVMSNRRLAEIVDPLAGQWPVESVAALRDGSHTLYTLHAGTTEINGDELTEYFFVTNDHSGKEGIRMGYTPVRMVCMNTLMAGVTQATQMVTMSHANGVDERVEFHAELFAQLRTVREETLTFFDQMGRLILTDNEIDHVFKAAWPEEEPSQSVALYHEILSRDGDAGIDALIEKYPNQWGRMKKTALDFESRNRRAEERREAAWERLEYWNDQNPAMANTAWNVWAGSVTEVSDWRDGRDDVAYSSVFGPRAGEKARAFATIVDLAFSRN